MKDGSTYLYAVLVVPYAVSCYWRVVTVCQSIKHAVIMILFAHLTCSETSWVVPASSTHLPRNSSPKNGFNGFFSDPYFSFLVLYDCFRLLKNHLSTSSALLAGSGSEAGATNIDGCSVQ